MKSETIADGLGRSWDLPVVDVPTAEAVVDATGVDLFAVITGGPEKMNATLGDPRKLIEVLAVMVGDQVDNRLDPTHPADDDATAFARGWFGDALEVAFFAVLEATIRFFPQRRQTILRRTLAAIREQTDAGLTIAEETIAGPEWAAMMESGLQELKQKLTNATPS